MHRRAAPDLLEMDQRWLESCAFFWCGACMRCAPCSFTLQVFFADVPGGPIPCVCA